MANLALRFSIFASNLARFVSTIFSLSNKGLYRRSKPSAKLHRQLQKLLAMVTTIEAP